MLSSLDTSSYLFLLSATFRLSSLSTTFLSSSLSADLEGRSLGPDGCLDLLYPGALVLQLLPDHGQLGLEAVVGLLALRHSSLEGLHRNMFTSSSHMWIWIPSTSDWLF